MQFDNIVKHKECFKKDIVKVLFLSFILATCWLLQYSQAMAGAESYGLTFNYTTDKGANKSKSVAAADGAEYTWSVTNEPAGSTYKWSHTGASGKWSGGGNNQDYIKLLPYGASGSYTVNVKVYPPGEGGEGTVWSASGSGSINEPTIEFNEPDGDQFVPKDDTPKNIPVEVVAKHGANTLGGVKATFSDANSKGSFSPNPDTTDGAGVASTVFTTSTTAGDVSILRAKTGSTPQVGPEVTVFEVEVATPSGGNDFDLKQNSYTQSENIPCKASVVPEDLTINWQLTLKYTTGGTTYTNSDKSFTTDHDETHNVTYASWGGNLTVVASVTIDDSTSSDTTTATITGLPSAKTGTSGTYIPYSDISSRLGTNLFRGVCWKESTYRQFTSSGWPLVAGNDRGLMQINAQWGSIRLYSWNWQSNIDKGKYLLNANHSQSEQHAENVGHSMTDYQHWNNALALYNTGDYYYIWDDDEEEWIPDPDNSTGVAYANSVRTYEQSKPWE